MEEEKGKDPKNESSKIDNTLNIGADNLFEVSDYVAANLSINPGNDSPKTEGPVVGPTPINSAESKEGVKSTEVSAVTPSTSSTQAELVSEVPGILPDAGTTVNISMEPTPITVFGPENNPGPINMVELPPNTVPAPVEGTISTESTNNLFEKKKEEKSSFFTKIKESKGFSNFIENMSESPLVKSLNLPNLKESGKDFLKVTKSEVLGGLPDFSKVKEEGVGFDKIKETSKDAINTVKESPLVEKFTEIRERQKDVFATSEKEQVAQPVPSAVTVENQKTELVEKSVPAVTETKVTSTATTTNVQNQTNQPATTAVTNQTAQFQPAQNQVPTQNNVTATQFQPSQMTNQLPQTQIPGQPVVFNFSEAERKLDRIFYALTNGLEVTIKQPY